MHTYFRARTVALIGDAPAEEFIKNGKVMAALVLSSYCQRIINAKAAGVKEWLDPRRLLVTCRL